MKKMSLPFLAQSCIFLHSLLLGCAWLTLNYFQVFSLQRAFAGVSVSMFLPWLVLVLLDALLVSGLLAALYVFYTRIGRASRSPLWRDIMSGYALPIALLLTAITCVFAAALFDSPQELLLLFPVFLWFLLKALGAPLAAWTISRKAFVVAVVPAFVTIAAYIFLGVANVGSRRFSPEVLVYAHAIFFLVDYVLSLWLYVLLAKLTRKEFYSPVLQTLWALFLVGWLVSFAASYYSDVLLARKRKQVAATWGAPLDIAGLRDVYYNGHAPDKAFYAALQQVASRNTPRSTPLIRMAQTLSSMPTMNNEVRKALDAELACYSALIDLVDRRLSSNQILKFPLDAENSEAVRALPYLPWLQDWASLLPARALCAALRNDSLALAQLWQCSHALHLSLSEEPFAASLQTNIQCLHYATTALGLAINADVLDEATLERCAQDLQLSRASLQKQLPLLRYGESALLNVAFDEIMQGSHSHEILLFDSSKLRPLLAPLHIFLRKQQREALTLFIHEDFCCTPRIADNWGVPVLLTPMKNLQATVQAACAKHRLLTCAVALERHLRQHGELPETLDALVPAFLANIPRDPFNEQPLRYELVNEALPVVTIVPVEGDGTAGEDDTPAQWQAKSSQEQLKAARIWSVGRNCCDDHGESHGRQFDDISFTRIAPR
ncbi:MAG: hypothetical protein ACOX9E_08240 [Lentisphaeria bacterium]|jgi:hypothetical protein